MERRGLLPQNAVPLVESNARLDFSRGVGAIGSPGNPMRNPGTECLPTFGLMNEAEHSGLAQTRGSVSAFLVIPTSIISKRKFLRDRRLQQAAVCASPEFGPINLAMLQ